MAELAPFTHSVRELERISKRVHHLLRSGTTVVAIAVPLAVLSAVTGTAPASGTSAIYVPNAVTQH